MSGPKPYPREKRPAFQVCGERAGYHAQTIDLILQGENTTVQGVQGVYGKDLPLCDFAPAGTPESAPSTIPNQFIEVPAHPAHPAQDANQLEKKPMRVARPGSGTLHAGTDDDLATRMARARELALAELAARSTAAYERALDAMWLAANPETIAAYALAAAHEHVEFYGPDGTDLGGEGWRSWASEVMSEFSTAELAEELLERELEERAGEALAFADEEMIPV